MSNDLNYYELLEIAQSATEEEIKKAFRRLSKEYHPDRVPEHLSRLKHEAEVKFKQLNAAYQVLSDPSRRKQYDEYLIKIKNQKDISHKAQVRNNPVPAQRQRIPVSYDRKKTAKKILRFAVTGLLLLGCFIAAKKFIFSESKGRAIITVQRAAGNSPGIPNADISGKWRGFYVEEDNLSNRRVINFELMVQQDRTKITGTMKENLGDKTNTAKISGKVHGRDIVFERRYPGSKTVMEYSGSIFESGNIGHGTWSSGDKEGRWRIERNQ